jgi:hypothetical protein
MKPYISTQQLAGTTLNSASNLLNRYFVSFLFTSILLLISIVAFSGKLKKLNTVSVGVSNSLFSDNVTNSPLSGSETIRATLYLLNANNTTTLADGVFAEYNNLYHDSVLLEDAFKFSNINENLGIVRYGAVLSVERRPIIANNDTLFLKLWKTSKRNYQFEFVTTNLDHPGMLAYVQDAYLGSSTALALNGTTKINFTVNAEVASSDVNRFKIVYLSNLLQAPLPVTFTSVKAFELNNRISIEWKVENELNIENYIVERSSNGTDFFKQSSIAVSGSNSIRNNYSWFDNNPLIGNSFYRVKSIGRDGSKKASNIMKVAQVKMPDASITIYPNPIQGNLINLQFKNQLAGTYQLRLINNYGQVVYAGSLLINSSNISQTVITNKQLVYGIYQLEIKAPDNMIQLKKAIVQQ